MAHSGKTVPRNGSLTPEQWEDLGVQYQAGIPVDQLSSSFGISKGVIYTKMSRLGLKRAGALKDAIITRTHEMLAADAANSDSDDDLPPLDPKIKYDPLTSDADRLVNAVAERAKVVIDAHRTDVALARSIYRRMIDGLNQMLDDAESDPSTVVALSSGLGTIVATMEKVIKLERQAWNMGDDDQGDQGDPMAEILERVRSAPTNSIRTIIQMKRVGAVTFEAEGSDDGD